MVLEVPRPVAPAFSWRTFTGTLHDRVVERWWGRTRKIPPGNAESAHLWESVATPAPGAARILACYDRWFMNPVPDSIAVPPDVHRSTPSTHIRVALIGCGAISQALYLPVLAGHEHPADRVGRSGRRSRRATRQRLRRPACSSRTRRN